MRTSCAFAVAGCLGLALCATPNFDYEKSQLTEKEADASPALAFGALPDDVDASTTRGPRCRAHPGGESWPSRREWRAFNESLGGVLLRGTPPGAPCYPDRPEYDPDECAFLTGDDLGSRVWIDNPVAASLQWAQGNTCPVEADPVGECTLGGYPAYVVNATSVRHIQMAVNFARNKNIRLTIRCGPYLFPQPLCLQ